MAKWYVEKRMATVRSSESGAVDCMRHLRTRQHLGKALVICERPDLFLATARRQWQKLARAIQRQRAMTLNADKVLKHTHTIITMQATRFTGQTPLENPEADVYFLPPGKLQPVPPHCYTVYLLAKLPKTVLQELLPLLPADALIIDYEHTVDWPEAGVEDKSVLEEQVNAEWRRVREFLHTRSIDIGELPSGRQHHIEAMDNALDALLEAPHKFLRIANDFQRALELARPMKISKELRLRYDALMLLAHRVQTLTMPAFNQQFLESYSEDDTFFLYDVGVENAGGGEALADAVMRHTQAGRKRLAAALEHWQHMRHRGRPDGVQAAQSHAPQCLQGSPCVF